MYRVPLHIEGVDLDDEETLSVIGAALADLSWAAVDGRVVATVHTDGQQVVDAVVDAARRITRSLAGSTVHEVDQELVSVSDIAHRVGVSREAVRLWSEGRRGPGDFPHAVGAPGSSKVWRWSRVSEWLQRHYALADTARYLDDRELAHVNYALLSTV